MSTTIDAIATVWTDSAGIPTRLVWQGQRFTVSDTPTPLDLDLEAVTHLTTVPIGWRFQGTSAGGDSLVFDVFAFDRANEWRVIRTYR